MTTGEGRGLRPSTAGHAAQLQKSLLTNMTAFQVLFVDESTTINVTACWWKITCIIMFVQPLLCSAY